LDLGQTTFMEPVYNLGKIKLEIGNTMFERAVGLYDSGKSDRI